MSWGLLFLLFSCKASSVESRTATGTIAAGDAFVCVIRDGGTVWCWGDNRAGELGGRTSESFSAVPAPVPGLQDIIQVAAARHWAAAVHRDGTVWTWGRDGWGMRGGDPDTLVQQDTPTQVTGLDHVTQLALGEMHGCALREDGSVWCWGNDKHGALGDAARFEATQPMRTTPPGRTPGLGVPPPGVEIFLGDCYA